MARLPALLEALTKVDGMRDFATLHNIARTIREAGLLPPTRRGKAANHVTLQNAADLLLALTPVVPHPATVNAARQYRSLRRLPRSSQGNGGVFKAISEAGTFGEAVEVLIRDADAFFEALADWTDDAWANLPENYRINFIPILQIQFLAPVVGANILILFDRGQGPKAEFEWNYSLDIDKPEEFYSFKDTDRQITVTVGLHTILKLHDALYEKSTPTGDEAEDAPI